MRKTKSVKHDLVVVICNWNKKDDIIDCLDSVYDACVDKMSVIVVDNASTDGSVEALENYCRFSFLLIKNSKNLGGSGGFNTGINAALQIGCKYIHLLDNDAKVETKTFSNALSLFKKNPEIGVIGSKILNSENPSFIQEMGANIDWDNFNYKPHFSNEKDSNEIPSIVNCDYVPACSVTIRAELIQQVGLMDEKFFLYWDDIEWFHRISKSGKKIICSSQVVAHHSLGDRKRKNTLGTYFFNRNRINFFLNNSSEEKIDICTETIFEDLFQSYFFSRIEKKFNTARTVLYAAIDALSDIRGKALNSRIKICEQSSTKFTKWLKEQTYIEIQTCCSKATKIKIIHHLKRANPSINFKEYPISLNSVKSTKTNKRSTYNLKLVDHVSNLCIDEIDLVNRCYVDKFYNFIYTQSDLDNIVAYRHELNRAKNYVLPLFKKRVSHFRKKLLEDS